MGTAFSVLIRLELSGPGVQYIADNQLYNSIITAHAIIMIFFMVEKNFILKSQPITTREGTVNSDNNNSLLISESDNNNDGYNGNKNRDNDDNKHENDQGKKHNYVKVLVDDPFNNRDILKVTKKQKGVYI